MGRYVGRFCHQDFQPTASHASQARGQFSCGNSYLSYSPTSRARVSSRGLAMDGNSSWLILMRWEVWKILIKDETHEIFFIQTGRKTMGNPQEQTKNELWKAQPWPPLLLRQKYHSQNSRKAIRLPVRLWSSSFAWVSFLECFRRELLLNIFNLL